MTVGVNIQAIVNAGWIGAELHQTEDRQKAKALAWKFRAALECVPAADRDYVMLVIKLVLGTL
jgi:hypothetical protein